MFVRTLPFSVPSELASRLQLQVLGHAAITEHRGISVQRLDGRGNQLSGLPRNVHLETAARAQTFYRASRPCFRQSRQELDFTVAALQQTLRDAGSTTEI